MSGVKVARVARTPAEKSEPMGKESLDFVNSLCLQREVEISVENLDKVGGFIGSMYVDKNNLAIELLTRGLAQIHEYSASQCFNEKALYAAEQVAKDGRVGIWSIIDPQSEEFAPSKASGLLSDEKMSSDYKDCILSDVLSSTLSVQLFTSGILE